MALQTSKLAILGQGQNLAVKDYCGESGLLTLEPRDLRPKTKDSEGGLLVLKLRVVISKSTCVSCPRLLRSEQAVTKHMSEERKRCPNKFIDLPLLWRVWLANPRAERETRWRCVSCSALDLNNSSRSV